ncbi:recombinase family protein [Acetobacter thailandicus]|uniref:recombinase family protein n=1 Tax=Acetobacter thailandicus TaxID=1502842 RepID=UPI001BABD534|nr:recombinase family protein [Acetobacter thailandicus]MBS0961466.1 recombinase family protein [Acetobacter thailandicus]
MTRVFIYVRYSSNNQSENSIRDQIRVCSEHAQREGWKVVNIYEDAALSGSSTVLRKGIQDLLADARRGQCDVILAEALDRISRDQADIASIFRDMKFAGVEIVTLAEGEIKELEVGLKGTMNALYLKDLAAKTHRGLRGRVVQGKAGGGLCYGYRLVRKLNAAGEPIRGDREIIPEQAHVIRRIYKKYAAGQSPRAIAVELNREGIPGPRGRAWGDTSIRGHVSRGTGILHNELYIGVMVWNRQNFRKVPGTGKRVSRPNLEKDWVRTEVPHLRIVDDGLWQAVRKRQKAIAAKVGPCPANTLEGRAKRLYLANRPVSLFSGLLVCGCCEGRVSMIVNSRFGCLNHHRRGTCSNNRTIRRERIEARVLAGLKDRLVSSDSMEAALQAFAEEMKRLKHERQTQSGADRKALEKIDRAIKGIMVAIEDGLYQSSMKVRLEDLQRQKAELEERLAQDMVDVPSQYPNIVKHYRRNVERFTEVLDDPDEGGEAVQAIRSLIGRIILYPGEKRGEVHISLRGDLMGILGFSDPRGKQMETCFMTAGEAGPRNQII